VFNQKGAGRRRAGLLPHQGSTARRAGAADSASIDVSQPAAVAALIEKAAREST